MKRFKPFWKKYKYNFAVFAMLVLTLVMSCAKNYFDNIFPFSEDGITWVSNLSFIQESLRKGEYPLWNKYLSVGMPAAANASMSCFYLPMLLLSFLPLKQFVYCSYILHLAIGSMFFFLLLKQVGCRLEIAAAMAFVYQFSVNLGGVRKTHISIIFTAVYLPIIIYFVEKYFETEKLKWLTFASIAMALQFCGGFMQCILYSDVFVGLYLLVGLFRRRKKWKKWMLHLPIWLIGYFGLIAVQLIPFIELLKVNSIYDQTSSSYDFFVSYSLHPVKLLQMFFPKIFVDEFIALGPNYSSGVDIELYMGPVVILLLISGGIIYKSDYRIRVYGIAAILVLGWASIARFPLVAHIICKLPFIGTTRVQSRVIFIFCFLVLLMVGYISELFVSRKDYQKVFEKIKIIVGIILVIVIAGFAGAFVYTGICGFEGEAWESLRTYFRTSYYKDIVLYLLCMLSFFSLYLNEQKREGKDKYIFLSVLLIINMIGVLPYSMHTDGTSIISVIDINSASDVFLKENVKDYKIWDDFTEINGAHQSNISQNKSVIKKMAGINSYTNFSNPQLYMMLSMNDNAPLNSSGLLTGNFASEYNLKTRNDVLSMLGIKYIIDTESFLPNSTDTLLYGDDVKEVLYLQDIKGEKNADGVFTSNSEILLKPKTFYKVTFCGYAEKDKKIYCDFYGEQYDSNIQQRSFWLTSEKKQYETYIFSGESVPEQSFFRFVCTDVTSEFWIDDIHITELETYGSEAYHLANFNGNDMIYENENVNEILYFSNVLEINKEYNIYEATGLGLNENSYIEGGEELENSSRNKEITDIDFGINRITANVYSDEKSFINFSQTYYPGWKVYVDGVEQKIYTVNGIIMGTYLPAGSHQIKFSYEPLSVGIGAAISFFTLILLIILSCFGSNKRDLRNAYN